MLLKNLRDGIATPRNSRGDYKLAETLLKSLRDHAVVGNPSSRERFQLLIDELNRKMVTAEKDAELLMIAGAAEQAIRQYETETNAYWHAQTNELQGIVSTITRALAEFGQRHSAASERLVKLENSIESISVLEDLREVRHRIEGCVATLRDENQRQRAAQTLLNQSLSGVAPLPPLAEDRATGLLSRQAAEALIVEQSGQLLANQITLALFVVHRIQQVNARYGYTVGDEMLKTFLKHLTSKLDAADRLFRWSGPAFLVLVRRELPLHAVEAEMRRIAAVKIDKELEIGDRGVMVPVSASVFLRPLAGVVHLETVTAELDHFASSHLQR